MKKIIMLGVAGWLSINLVACGGDATKEESTVEQDATNQVGGMVSDDNLEAYVYEGKEPASEDEALEDFEKEGVSEEEEVLDLTDLSSTMVYAEIYNMLVVPEDYVGKTIKIEGIFDILEDPETGKIYTACVVYDATACCAQGIEFVMNDAAYPEDYPELYTPITITGVFQETPEDAVFYFNLVDAVLEEQVIGQ